MIASVTLPASLRPQQWLNLLNRLGHPTQTKWNVRIMERYAHGAGVVTYLARYLRGGPLKNARLVAWDGDRVTFTYRARQEGDAGRASPLRMTLPVVDFLRRWLLHVPVPQTRVARSYGLYHHAPTEALAHCRAALGHHRRGVPVKHRDRLLDRADASEPLFQLMIGGHPTPALRRWNRT